MADKVVASGYGFELGHPSNDTAQRAYDESDLHRAIEAYRFFYPTVSGAAMVHGNHQIGIVEAAGSQTMSSRCASATPLQPAGVGDCRTTPERPPTVTRVKPW